MATEQSAPEELVERVQELLGSLDEIADPVAHNRVQELIGAVLELYGAGLERILGVLTDAGEPALPIREAFLEDGVISSLLLIHGLFPVPLEERVQQGLVNIRPFLAGHGGNVELIGVENGIARLKLQGSCDGCPASASTLENALRDAIDEVAPDLLGLEVEGAVGLDESQATPAGLSLPMVQVGGTSLPMADAPYTECPSGVGK